MPKSALNYQVVTVNKKLYQVLETPTQQVVWEHKTQDLAKKHVKKLNLGGGFDGFTPSFMVQ